METIEVDLAVKSVQYFNEPAHVRPLEPVRQVDVHVHFGDGFLGLLLLVQKLYRVRDGLDTNLPDIYTPVIVQVLDVFHVQVLKNRKEKYADETNLSTILGGYQFNQDTSGQRFSTHPYWRI